MGMSLAPRYYLDGYEPDPDFAHDPPYGPAMQAAQQRVCRACLANGVKFYSTMRANDWREVYDMGARMSSAGRYTLDFLEDVRRHAGRTMPA
jgi:hypothetical protein